MSRENKPEDYLAKATEAETRAAKSTDEKVKASWLRVAASYRDLAGASKAPEKR
jgi:hypothetical protein